jgi:hypothetical protein
MYNFTGIVWNEEVTPPVSGEILYTHDIKENKNIYLFK